MIEDTEILQIERTMLVGASLPTKVKPGHLFLLVDQAVPDNNKLYIARAFDTWTQLYPPATDGTLTSITSVDESISVGNPTGPVVNISASAAIQSIATDIVDEALTDGRPITANSFQPLITAVDRTLSNEDSFALVDTTSGNITITLYAGNDITSGKILIAKKRVAGNSLIISGNGKTIDGNASVTLLLVGAVLRLIYSDNEDAWFSW